MAMPSILGNLLSIDAVKLMRAYSQISSSKAQRGPDAEEREGRYPNDFVGQQFCRGIDRNTVQPSKCVFIQS